MVGHIVTHPSYSLTVIQNLVAARKRVITHSAQKGAGNLGLDEHDIVDCIAAMDQSCFYKTMPAEKRPGSWQDVYLTEYAGFRLYVKMQIIGTTPAEMAVVISFKRSTT